MYAASTVGSAVNSVYSKRFKLGGNALALGRGGDELDASRRPSVENAVFGVLFTLSKENSETRIVIRWVLIKILLDGWQLFTTVIQPEQGWDINPDGTVWRIVSILSFNWLADLGYGAYVALLYGMVGLLAINIGLCVWVAWCFKEQKFPVVWPIKVLRLFTSVFFQAFDVTSLNLLQIGFTCQYTGPAEPHLHLKLFPTYSCAAMPQVVHAVVSGVSLLVFIILAQLCNMAEVEVNPKSRRPMALGHSGAEVMAFGIKVVMTLTDVFLGWKKVSASIYLVLSIAMAWQYLRWSPHLVNWVNHLKTGLAVVIVWCSAVLMFLVFHPGVKQADMPRFSTWMTITMLAGIIPAVGAGAALSWWLLRRNWRLATRAIGLAAEKNAPLEDMTVNLWTDPRDIEIAARVCRVWVDRNILDKEAVAKSQTFIKAGLNLFPGNAFVSLVQANFMIDVLGVGQSGSRQIEAARKLKPGMMSRFVIFVRMQQAQQAAAGSNAGGAVGNNMDLLGFVEYQRKQRMVVRLHRDALTAMCSFWKALDSHTVSFTYLSKALAGIEVSVARAQSAYHLVLETYGTNFRLVRLYGKFLETVKNDPWGALEYYTEADRLEQEKNDNGGGPLLPDGTPLSRMDELSTAVVVITASGEVQMANKQVHHLFGYKKGDLDGKPLTMLLAPQSNKRITKCLAGLVERTMAGLGQGPLGGQDDHTASTTTAVLGMHHERMAFPLRVSITKASGVGEDSTFIALLEPVHVSKDVSYFWVAANGVIAGCDPQFVANFGFMPQDVIGAHLGDFLVVDGDVLALRARLEATNTSAAAIDRWDVEASSIDMSQPVGESVTILHSIVDKTTEGQDAPCHVSHRYSPPLACVAAARQLDLGDATLFEVKLCRASPEPYLMLVTDRKGAIKYATPQLTTMLCPRGSNATGGQMGDADAFKDRTDADHHKGVAHHGLAILSGVAAAHGLISGYSLQDFLPHPWKDTHVKLLKEDAAAATNSRNIWSCTRQGGCGPTMEIQDAHGLRMHMHVSVSSAELVGEHLHIIRMANSNVEAAVSERRLQLSVNNEGIITGVSKDTPSQLLFGFDSNLLIGVPLWEILDGVEQQLLNRPGSSLGRVNGMGKGSSAAFSSILEKAIRAPGRSYRVSVVPPPSHHHTSSFGVGSPATVTANAELAAAQRAAQVRRGIIQLHVPVLESAEEEAEGGGAGKPPTGGPGGGRASMDGFMPPSASQVGMLPTPSQVGMLPSASQVGNGATVTSTSQVVDEEPPALLVDVWPTSAVSGLLELNGMGRIMSALEEPMRPAGLLFGLPTKSLIGQAFSALVPLPPGREEVGDLLSASARNKKSSLKQSQKDPTVKVGPIHILQAVHSDGKPVNLAVQVIGKPGSGQSLTVLIRVQSQPMAPGGAAATAAAAGGGGAAAGKVKSGAQLTLPPAPPPAPPPRVAAPPPEPSSSDDDSPPSIREMEDIVEGRSFREREKPTTANGMRASATGLRASVTGMSTTAAMQVGRSFRDVADKDKDKEREKPREVATLEKSGTAKFTGTGMAGDSRTGSARGARPATPSTPVKAPAELLAAHVTGSAGTNSNGQGTPETLTLPPPPPAGAPGAGPGGPPPMPAALAALGMDLPLPGVVMGGGAGGGPLGPAGSRRNSVAREPVASPLPPPPPPKREQSSLPGSDEESDTDIEGSAGVSKDGASSKEDASSQGKKKGGEAGGKKGDADDDDDVQLINPKHMARIKEWVESKGEVYQNTRKAAGDSGYEDATAVVAMTGADADADGETTDATEGKERSGGGAPPEGGPRNIGGVGAVSAFGVRGPGYGRSTRQLWGVASKVGSLAASAAAAEGGGGGGSGAVRRTSNTGMGLPPGLAPPLQQQGLAGDFDDAASAGGQSAMSGNSAGTSSGAEYKRGKRFRNLVKLMDSSEAEQVLRRFRHGALITMAILAVAHTICFAMVVVSIKGQQNAMSQLFVAGRCQRLLYRVLVNVRALDQVYKGKGEQHLYTTDNVQGLADIILSYGTTLKDLNNDVADANVDYPAVKEIYYFRDFPSWYAHNATTGQDIYKDSSLWDMITKVYTSSKDIYQNHANWSSSGVNISSTGAGNFLFHSGPTAFYGMRSVLDALLYKAMDDTDVVNNLLMAFLVVEGCGVSVLAAALLAYLLRRLALQRYRLYGTFLAIPVGLTRALTSQLANTTLLEEEDDDDSDDDGRDDDENGDKSHHHGGDGGGGDSGKHRHATLDPSPSSPPPAAPPPARPRPSFGDTVLAAANMAKSVAAASDGPGAGGGGGGGAAGRQGAPSPMVGGNSGVRWRSSSFKGRVLYRLSRWFPCLARRSQTVFPTAGPGGLGEGGHHHHKRNLKLDSNDTVRLLMPFVLWSVMVIIFYAVSVVELNQSGPLVAGASVCNFNAARTYSACFYAQELAAEENVARLEEHRTNLRRAATMLRDAFYTLQLGDEAYKTLGPDTERFPLVTNGISYETESLRTLFYSNTACLRTGNNLPCPGSEYRYYQVTHTGVDSMMQLYLSHLNEMADEVVDVVPGLNNTHFDFIYNVGTKDLTDANIRIGTEHYDFIKRLFSNILLLHILLFVLLWFFLAGFYLLLLKPLLLRLAREKRHIAELMSQLPLELDVEKLVRAALAGGAAGATSGGHGAADAAAVQGQAVGAGGAGQPAAGTDAARAWKNVLRSTSNAIKDANQAARATRERRASMMSMTSMAPGM